MLLIRYIVATRNSKEKREIKRKIPKKNCENLGKNANHFFDTLTFMLNKCFDFHNAKGKFVLVLLSISAKDETAEK